MSSRFKSLLGATLKFLLAGGLIAWLIATDRLDLKSVASLFQGPQLLWAFGLIGLNLWLVSERWRSLVLPLQLAVDRWSVFRLTLIGVFFNYAMPGGVGGDVVKAYYFTRENPKTRALAVTSVVLDRAMGLYAMMMMAVAVMLWDWTHVTEVPVLHNLFLLMSLLFTGLSFAWVLLFSRRVRRLNLIPRFLGPLPLSTRLIQLYEAAHSFGLSRRRVIWALFLSLLSQAIAICFLWIAGRAAGHEEVALGTYFLIAPLGYMATAIPLSPAGIGVGQAAFFFLFNLYLGTETQIGATVITAQQVITAFFGLWGAVLYLRQGRYAAARAM